MLKAIVHNYAQGFFDEEAFAGDERYIIYHNEKQSGGCRLNKTR